MTTRRGPDVEARAVAHRLGDAERDRDRDRSSSVVHRPSEIDTGSLSIIRSITGALRKKLLAEIEGEIVAASSCRKRSPAACRSRTACSMRWMSSGAGRARRGSCSPPPSRRSAGAARLAAAAAREARGGADRGALELGDHLLDRPARRRLDDDEIDHHDAEQRRDHQQQAAQDVGEHRQASRCSTVAAHCLPPVGCAAPCPCRIDPPGVEAERCVFGELLGPRRTCPSRRCGTRAKYQCGIT